MIVYSMHGWHKRQRAVREAAINAEIVAERPHLMITDQAVDTADEELDADEQRDLDTVAHLVSMFTDKAHNLGLEVDNAVAAAIWIVVVDMYLFDVETLLR